MKNHLEAWELIRKYVKGELSDEENSTLEKRFLKEPELRQEVEFTELLIEGSGKMEEERLIGIITEIDTNEKKPRTFPLWWLTRSSDNSWNYQQIGLMAALVLVIIAVGIWWFTPDTDPAKSFVADAYIRPELSVFVIRGTENNYLSAASSEYLQGNYQQSLDLLNENIQPQDSLYLFALLLKGHNLYHLSDYNEAIQTFDELTTQLDPSTENIQPNPDNIAWTRILSMLSLWNESKEEKLKNDLIENLNDFLNKANPSDTYYQRALQLKGLLQ